MGNLLSGIGFICNGICACLWLSIYLTTKHQIFLILFLCSVGSGLYNYIESQSNSKNLPTVSPTTPTRPCINSEGRTLDIITR